MTAVIAGIFAYLFAHVWIFYRYKQEKVFTDEDLGLKPRIVKFVFVDVWDFFSRTATAGKDFWTQFFFEEAFTRKGFVKFWIFSFLLFVILSLFVFVSGVDNLLVTHILVPLGFCWFPVAAWLAAKTIETDSEVEAHVRKAKLRVGVIMFVSLLPLFLLPFAMHDVGSIYAGLAVFLSLFVILFKKSAGSRLFGWMSLIFLVVGVGLVFTLFLNLDAFLGKARSVGLGKAAPRILAFKDGANFQHKLLASDAGSNDNELGLNVIDLTNVHEHSWENKAIAFEGGVTGFGFGNAPVRASQIRQDTLQFDSVYSFFIVGDFGFIGGVFLLILYFIPLLLVYFCGRYKFDVGFSVALAICSVFLLDGLFHAAMNIGVAPFTGRDLPLLAVHSFKGDFLRWTVFFGLLINALYWRYSEDGEIGAETVCLLTNERNLQKQVDSRNAEAIEALESEEAAPPKPKKNLWRVIYSDHSETWRQLAWLTLFPLLILLAIVAAQISIYRDTDLRIFSWKILKEDIDWAIANRMITALPDPSAPGGADCPRLVLDENQYRLKWKDEDLSNSFLHQQINRFNAAPCGERVGQRVFPGVLQDLGNVSNYESYQVFLNSLRESDLSARKMPKANLFALEKIRKERLFDENEYPYEVKFNPAFNVRRSFNETQKVENMPVVKTSDNVKLLGSAWVKGKWITVLDNLAMLPWTDWLADSMSLEWERLKSPAAQAMYGTLSLDSKLQNTVTAFIDKKGISHHRQNFGAGRNPWDKLPPRIGLTVLRLSSGNNNGAVLALGSFPRATSGNKWKKISYGQETLWLPPAKLVEKRFPSFLRQLYGGDRNFENVSVMGSSTKPMWAEAVLSAHLDANLQNKFKVRGSAVDDDSVFGIKITDKNWKGHGSKQEWVDFNTFLAESNNRYQVLFGFLGLTQSNKTEILTEAEQSPSVLETMGTRPWKRYPKFDEKIGFSFKNQKIIENLDKTELALRLRRIFGIATFDKTDADQTNEYSFYLNSFWTKNENHDALRLLEGEESLPQINTQIQNNLVPAILPTRLNLKLNRVSKPRDFVALLLGGSDNRWSNVQAAAGFATVITGKPVLPHIVKNDQLPVFYGRSKEFVSLAKILRPGLENVVFAENGTANPYLKKAKTFDFLQQLRRKGFLIYAKTGTLGESDNVKLATAPTDENTTRLLLVIVKFEDNDKTKVAAGLVFSIFVEKSRMGTAAEWLGEFLTQNSSEITRILEQP
jgi:cell division protein FtsW (lipid II flippase)